MLVIGPGGAGKSTFARRFGELTGVEVVHLDSLYWRPGWVETPKPEWAEVVASVLARESWIVDGNYSGTLEQRIAACDGVVFLDLPRRTCVWRVLKRALRYRGKTRPDMAQGCPEKLDLSFIGWIWNYRTRTRPKVLRLLETLSGAKRVIRLQSPAEVEQYLMCVRDGVCVNARDEIRDARLST